MHPQRINRVTYPPTWLANLVGDILLLLVFATIDDCSKIRRCDWSIRMKSSTFALKDYSNNVWDLLLYLFSVDASSIYYVLYGQKENISIKSLHIIVFIYWHIVVYTKKSLLRVIMLMTLSTVFSPFLQRPS